MCFLFANNDNDKNLVYFLLPEVEVNLAKCSASSGAQKMAGRSGEEHDVFVLHKQDGSVWLRFGEGDMEKKWNKVN